MTIKAIFALDENNVLGYADYSGYHQPFFFEKDLQNFQRLTKNQCVVMGSNTFKALHETPLKNRLNLVVSHTLKSDKAIVLPRVEDAVKLAKELKTDMYVIGGAALLYSMANIIDEFIITRVHSNYEIITGSNIKFLPILVDYELVVADKYSNQLDKSTGKKVDFTIEYWKKKEEK